MQPRFPWLSITMQVPSTLFPQLTMYPEWRTHVASSSYTHPMTVAAASTKQTLQGLPTFWQVTAEFAISHAASCDLDSEHLLFSYCPALPATANSTNPAMAASARLCTLLASIEAPFEKKRWFLTGSRSGATGT